MKRRDLVRELERAGCHLHRHGGRHDVYMNPANGRKAPVPRHSEIPVPRHSEIPVPRHSEISDSLSRLIRKQLGLE